jgi:hypothetical protein
MDPLVCPAFNAAVSPDVAGLPPTVVRMRSRASPQAAASSSVKASRSALSAIRISEIK